MRIRTIKPDFFFDDKVAELNFTCRLAFIGLWCHADREGRMVDNVPKLKALIFPYDKVDMEKMLQMLTKKPFIHRYAVNATRYIQIVNWDKHQRVHHTEPVSSLPLHNGQSFQEVSPAREDNGATTVDEPLLHGKEGKGKERKGKEGELTPRNLYREFVYLSDKEYALLVERLGKSDTELYIEKLNDYIGAKGKKYNSHFHVISGWWRKDNPDVRPRRQL